MRWLFRLFRSVMFLAVLTATLFVTTAVLAVQVKHLKTSIATASASAAASAIAHRKALNRANAKARLRRYVSAIPIAGMAAAAYFERRDFAIWQEDNPDGTFEDYSCEVVTASAEVMNEVLQELPEQLRPSRDTVWDSVLSALPECQQAEL